MQKFITSLKVCRISAIVLTGLAFSVNYHVIVNDSDYQRLTKEKLYLINHQIELKDCSKNRELLLTDVSVELYRTRLGKILECIQDNKSKMPSTKYFYSDIFLEKLLNYQTNLTKIDSNLFVSLEVQEKIDFLLTKEEIIFFMSDVSFRDFKSNLFLRVLSIKYPYWLSIHILLVAGTIVLCFGTEEFSDEEQEESLFFDNY